MISAASSEGGVHPFPVAAVLLVSIGLPHRLMEILDRVVDVVERREVAGRPSQPNRPEHNHNYVSIAQIHDYPTRYSQQRHHYIPAYSTFRTRTTTHSISHTTERNTKAWNSIPTEIRNINNHKKFKQTLKQYLLKQQSQ